MRHSKRSREERRQDAVDRDEMRRRRTPEEQMSLIRQRPGNSIKEREKLIALIETKRIKRKKEGK